MQIPQISRKSHIRENVRLKGLISAPPVRSIKEHRKTRRGRFPEVESAFALAGALRSTNPKPQITIWLVDLPLMSLCEPSSRRHMPAITNCPPTRALLHACIPTHYAALRHATQVCLDDANEFAVDSERARGRVSAYRKILAAVREKRLLPLGSVSGGK